MNQDRWSAFGFGVGIHLARFFVIIGALTLGPLVGISGWYLGLAANVACVIFAVSIVTARKLWRTSGILVAWRGRLALLFLLPLFAEVLVWALPSGLRNDEPGFGMWALTLVLVGVNEELTSRVVVLERMRRSFPPLASVAVTAALFGLQHLSALATTSRTLDDVALNVVASSCYGFVLAAFQFRYRWVTPLIVVHAAADFTTILSVQPVPDAAVAVTLVVFLILGFTILRSARVANRHSSGHQDTASP
ncbi:CPBP family intramembrane metalloprotease [Nakamurella antarctica]|uniref:CPBP family intramembrane metalloprotease n=1 Tax=Nakamurella antarctica TaxID=1902245 RepID=A0A3G8ZP22_9ACTN|nr:CPBP family intramembrane glutamic endopeptidase [Nakamurella antarctica]AZI59000.1 CPBP family intramembrane metalloprotease [Nakamurella antarctica]